MATEQPRPPFPYEGWQWMADEGVSVEYSGGDDGQLVPRALRMARTNGGQPASVSGSAGQQGAGAVSFDYERMARMFASQVDSVAEANARFHGWLDAQPSMVSRMAVRLVLSRLGLGRSGDECAADSGDPVPAVDADLREQSARSLHALQCVDPGEHPGDCPDPENHWQAWGELAEAALRPVVGVVAEYDARIDHLQRCATRDRADMMEAKGQLAARNAEVVDGPGSRRGHVRITVDAEADAAYVYLVDPILPGEAVTQVVAGDGRDRSIVVLDFDGDGRLLGVEVLGARDRLRPATVERAESSLRPMGH